MSKLLGRVEVFILDKISIGSWLFNENSFLKWGIMKNNIGLF